MLTARVMRAGRSNLSAALVLAVIGAVGLSACASYGRWLGKATPAPTRAIHAALLPTGKVLLVAGSGNDRDRFLAGSFDSTLWDPATDTFQTSTTPFDLFCAGHAFLPDGRLLVAGGTADYAPDGSYEFKGEKRTTIYNPWTEQYEPGPEMGVGRWYPTLVNLGDGRVLSVAGADENGESTPTFEVFDGVGWSTPQDAPDEFVFPYYPSLHLAADGRLFYSGVSTGGGRVPAGFWDTAAGTFAPLPVPERGTRDQGASIMLPPAQDQRVMVIGGGNADGRVSTTSTEIVDLDAPEPAWTPAEPIDLPKMYVSAVILPDQTVLQTNGLRTHRNEGGDAQPVKSTQIFDPRTGHWRKVADAGVPRGYHSEALLLPDGRVATFGGDPSGDGFEMRVEIFTPSYLLENGPQPTIESGPSELVRHEPAHYLTTQARPITSVVLVRPSAVTHSTDVEQRLVTLPFETTDDGLGGTGVDATLDVGPTVAPAGWYMLFAVDSLGIPSIAKWVHVGEPPG